MLDPKEREEVEKGLRVARLIWLAFLVALLFYAVLSHLVGEKPRNAVWLGLRVGLLRNLLFGMAAVSFGAAYFLRKSIRQNAKSTNPASTYLFTNIISFVFCESIGIYGFFFFILSGEQETLYLLLLLAAIALIPLRPKQEELEQLMIAMKHRQ